MCIAISGQDNLLKNKPLSEKRDFFKEILQSDIYWTAKKAIINQLKNEKFEDKKKLIQFALNTKNTEVRQAVASIITEIPEDFREEYENLLSDKSYQTQEIALVNLCKNFPEYRNCYLDKSKNWIGFNDYNLRILWLSLAISTPGYLCDKDVLEKELINYSSNLFEATIRQNAIENLMSLGVVDTTFLRNLVNLTTHHTWNYSKFGKETIQTLLKNRDRRIDFENILSNLNEKEQFQLNRLLKK